jgi:hypothetical protein
MFLIGYLLEVGPTVATGMGAAAIGWRDVEAWQACLGIRVPPWQARLLVELSREYVSFSRSAEKPDCPSPLSAEMDDTRRERVARALRIGFRAMIMSKEK